MLFFLEIIKEKEGFVLLLKIMKNTSNENSDWEICLIKELSTYC